MDAASQKVAPSAKHFLIWPQQSAKVRTQKGETDMKQITIAGKLGKDAELRSTQNGDKLASFSVAVDDGYGQNKRTLWFDCTVFGKRGETLAPMLSRGTPVTVSGDFSTREHNDKTYLTVRVNELTLQGGRKQESRGGYDQSPKQNQSRSDIDDDLPF
jgi:single-strand DNA-binding protein